MSFDKIASHWIAYFKRKIKELPKKKPSEIVAIISSILVPGGLAYISATDKFSTWIAPFVTITKNGTPIEAEFQINKYFISIVVFVYIVSILISFGAIFSKELAIKRYSASFNKLKSRYNNNLKKFSKIQAAYTHVTKQAVKLRYQFADLPLSYNFTKHHSIYEITRNGDVSVTKEIEIQANDEPVSTWLLFIDGFPHADDALTFNDIALQVVCLDDKACVVIPQQDSLKRKEILIFFVPQLAPHEKRHLCITYKWTKMFAGLLLQGEDQLSWSNNGRRIDLTTDFKTEVRVERTVGNVIAEISGPRPAGTNLEKKHDEKYTIITYEIPKMPNDQATYSLGLKIVKNTTA